MIYRKARDVVCYATPLCLWSLVRNPQSLLPLALGG